jgi:hypothetical protein
LWEAELAVDPGGVDPLSAASSLLDRLAQVPDPRRLRGLRHPLLVILVLTACATLVAGNDSVTAIRQWAARTPQDVLHRIGARYNPLLGRYTVPSERTFRRVLMGLDGDALDAATCGYAADVVRGDAPPPVYVFSLSSRRVLIDGDRWCDRVPGCPRPSRSVRRMTSWRRWSRRRRRGSLSLRLSWRM